MPVRVGQEVQTLPWGDRVAPRADPLIDDTALARPPWRDPVDRSGRYGSTASSSGGDHVGHERDAYPPGGTDGRVELAATLARVALTARVTTRNGRGRVPWAPEA